MLFDIHLFSSIAIFRLSEANMGNISQEIEQVYSRHSKNGMVILHNHLWSLSKIF